MDPPRPPETFETERLLLRPIAVSDAPGIFAYAGDAEAAKFMIFPLHRTLADTDVFAQRCVKCWQTGSAFPWAIVVRATGDFAGCIELRIQPPKADFGYILCRSHWNRGIASEAAAAVVTWARAQPAIYRVWTTCHPDNIASTRVLEKSGLRLEGRLARWEPRPNLDEVAGDSLVYAVTRPDAK